MADLSVNKNDTTYIRESAGFNPILNSDFESVPTFVAATTTGNRWIDGNAVGSSSDDSHVWAILSITGSGSAQFDNSTSHSGTYSLKISTTAITSRIQVSNLTALNPASNALKYCYPALPSTTYKLTYWMKTTVNSGTDTNGALVQLFDIDAAGAAGSSTTSTGVKTTTGWTQYSLSRTTGATAAFLLLELNIFGNQGTATLIMDAWFDDLSLYPVSRQNGVDAVIGPIVTPGIQDTSGPKIWG
jgi:hypothetical protein